MSQLLRPAIALMNRLRYPQKFLLISLLLLRVRQREDLR